MLNVSTHSTTQMAAWRTKPSVCRLRAAAALKGNWSIGVADSAENNRLVGRTGAIDGSLPGGRQFSCHFVAHRVVRWLGLAVAEVACGDDHY